MKRKRSHPPEVWDRYRRALADRARRFRRGPDDRDPTELYPPDERWLYVLPQWVTWRLEPNAQKGKPDKVPYGRDGKRARANDPTTWLTFPAARHQCETGQYEGLGFQLHRDDPYTFVDLDNCRDAKTGVIAEWAQAIVERFASLTEVSQSGAGLHIFVRGTPAWNGKEGGKKPWQDGAVEVYSGGRFAAMTFDLLPGYHDVSEVDQSAALDALCREVAIDLGSEPRATDDGGVLPPPRNTDLTDDAVRNAIYAGPDGRAFHRFMTVRDGEELLALKIYKSLSDADWDLARIFIRQVGGDVERVEALMRTTPLARAKWDRHTTYLREHTIAKAALTFGIAPPPGVSDAPALRGYSDLAVLDLPDPTHLIEGVLLDDSWNVVAGRWGAGKTFVQLDWCLHVAAGVPWHDRKVRRGPTLLVFAEGAVKSRVAAWRTHHRVDPTTAVGLTVAPGTVNLLDDDAVGAFIRQVEAGDLGDRPVLIAIETLARSIPGGDENSSETMSRVSASIGRIQADVGTTVSITHHSPWEAKRLRGFSGLGDAADTIYYLENANPDASRDDAMRLTLTCQKFREGEWPPPLQLRLTPFGGSRVVEADPDPRPDQTATGPATSSTRLRQQWDDLKEAMGAERWTIAELIHKTGRSRSRLLDDLSALEAGKEIEIVAGKGRRGDPFVYRVTDPVEPI